MIIQKTREMYFFLLIFIPMNTNIHASLFSFCEKLQFFKSRDGNYFVKCLIKQHVRRTSASKGRHFIGWTVFFLGLLTSVILWLKWKQHEMSLILFDKLHKKHIKMWKQTLLNILICCCLFFFIELSLASVDLTERNMTQQSRDHFINRQFLNSSHRNNKM